MQNTVEILAIKETGITPDPITASPLPQEQNPEVPPVDSSVLFTRDNAKSGVVQPEPALTESAPIFSTELPDPDAPVSEKGGVKFSQRAAAVRIFGENTAAGNTIDEESENPNTAPEEISPNGISRRKFLKLVFGIGLGIAGFSGTAVVIGRVRAARPLRKAENPTGTPVPTESAPKKDQNSREAILQKIDETLHELNTVNETTPKPGVDMGVRIILDINTDGISDDLRKNSNSSDLASIKTEVAAAKNVVKFAKLYLDENPTENLETFNVLIVRTYNFTIATVDQNGITHDCQVVVISKFTPTAYVSEAEAGDRPQDKIIEINVVGNFDTKYNPSATDLGFKFGKIKSMEMPSIIVDVPSPNQVRLIKATVAPKLPPDEGDLMTKDAQTTLDTQYTASQLKNPDVPIELYIDFSNN